MYQSELEELEGDLDLVALELLPLLDHLQQHARSLELASELRHLVVRDLVVLPIPRLQYI
jgi:hypothetical protein